MTTPEMRWIRGFSRGITNDPPDNCPDPSCMPDKDGGDAEYIVGWRLGKKLAAAGKGLDLSSTLIVKGYPDGTKVDVCPDDGDGSIDPRNFGVVPLRCAIGSGWWRVYVRTDPPPPEGACPFIAVYFEGNTTATIDAGQLSQVSGTGPFRGETQ